MTTNTTIRLPPKLRARIQALAEQSGRSAQSLIVEAVERHADSEERMRSLGLETIADDTEMEPTEEVHRAQDVHAWMNRLADAQAPARPTPWRR